MQAAEDEAFNTVQKVALGSVLLYLCKTFTWTLFETGSGRIRVQCESRFAEGNTDVRR